MQTKNQIFVVCLLIIVTMSYFCGAAGIGTFSEDIGGDVDEPDVWDALTFVGGGFWGLLTFDVEVPDWLSLFFWLILAVWTWSIIAMIRGTS